MGSGRPQSMLVLGFTIKPERVRTHIGPVCSTHFQTFKGGRRSPSRNASITAMGTSALASSQSHSRRGGTTSNEGRRFHGEAPGGPEETLTIQPGLYGFDRLKEVLKGTIPTHTLTASRESGLITLTVAPGRGVRLSDGLLALLGLDDGLGGVWLDGGVYTGDRPVNFATRQML